MLQFHKPTAGILERAEMLILDELKWRLFIYPIQAHFHELYFGLFNENKEWEKIIIDNYCY